MDSELIRFRIDPEIRAKAEAVCLELGHELHDVLRAVIVRIARDHAIPFELNSPALPPSTPVPFLEYDETLWAPLKPQIEAQLALTLLAQAVTDCSIEIDREEQKAAPDRERLAKLAERRTQAKSSRLTLNVADHEAVATVLRQYGTQQPKAAG